MYHQKFIKAYESGIITEYELCHRLISGLDENNINEFMANCPKDVLDKVDNIVKNAPTDDNGWSRMVYVCANMSIDAMKNEGIKHRKGIELYRKIKCGKEN